MEAWRFFLAPGRMKTPGRVLRPIAPILGAAAPRRRRRAPALGGTSPSSARHGSGEFPRSKSLHQESSARPIPRRAPCRERRARSTCTISRSADVMPDPAGVIVVWKPLLRWAQIPPPCRVATIFSGGPFFTPRGAEAPELNGPARRVSVPRAAEALHRWPVSAWPAPLCGGPNLVTLQVAQSAIGRSPVGRVLRPITRFAARRGVVREMTEKILSKDSVDARRGSKQPACDRCQARRRTTSGGPAIEHRFICSSLAFFENQAQEHRSQLRSRALDISAGECRRRHPGRLQGSPPRWLAIPDRGRGETGEQQVLPAALPVPEMRNAGPSCFAKHGPAPGDRPAWWWARPSRQPNHRCVPQTSNAPLGPSTWKRNK